MDIIMFVVTIVGTSLTVALLFATTVLSLKWSKLFAIHRRKKNSNEITIKQKQIDVVNGKAVSEHLQATTINSDMQIKTKSKTQTLVQFKRTSRLSELVNKKVKTCEMLDIGQVINIDKQALTVLHESKQQYTIPTYFIREYNQEYLVTDISIRYLYHYKPEQAFQSS
ncbi:MAG: hypothetical protein JO327_04410 [Nitrososphaeraceae archaeon]|nr:hypothetical protein [Nitrososphaeraceae archaeon]